MDQKVLIAALQMVLGKTLVHKKDLDPDYTYKPSEVLKDWKQHDPNAFRFSGQLNTHIKTIKTYKTWYIGYCSPSDLDIDEDVLDINKVDEAKEEIESRGEVDPIIVIPNKQNTKLIVLDGNHRAQAAKELGKDLLCYAPIQPK